MPTWISLQVILYFDYTYFGFDKDVTLLLIFLVKNEFSTIYLELFYFIALKYQKKQKWPNTLYFMFWLILVILAIIRQFFFNFALVLAYDDMKL